MGTEKLMEKARRSMENSLEISKKYPIDWDTTFRRKREAKAVWTFAATLCYDMDEDHSYTKIQDKFDKEWDEVYAPRWDAMLETLRRH